MQVEKKSSITTAKSAKDYLSKNEIPQLFECLMTGLMYHRPSDHITYLQECLERIKKQGVNGVRWDMFLDSKKTPLPPIDSVPRENYRPQPLPEIGSLQLLIPMDASIVLVQGGPGIDKKTICKSLTTNYSNYIHIDVGTTLRERAILEAGDGDSRWRSMKSVIDQGDLCAEDFVIECLIKEINKHDDNSKFIIEGFPRTDKQRIDFERFIGFHRLKFMLLIDCEEDTCQKQLMKRMPHQPWCDHGQPSINKRIFNYKSNTLAVCKYFDDLNKLRVVDGDRERDLVLRDIQRLFAKELDDPGCLNPPTPPDNPQSRTPEPVSEPVLASPSREPITDIEQLTEIAPERSRILELPQCRIILILGGPGAGKTEVAQRVCGKHPTWVHVDVNDIIRSRVMNDNSEEDSVATCDTSQPFVENWNINLDALKEILKSVPEDTEVIILEGYPKNSQQLNQFNTEIGRADFAILLDSEEETMRARLSEKYCRLTQLEDEEINVDSRMLHFKDHGLPVCRYYDEVNKMCIVPGDRDLLDVASDFEKVALRKLEIIKDAEALLASQQPPVDQFDMDDEMVHAAAIKIQSTIRGHLVRKNLKKNAPGNENNNTVIEQDDEMGNPENDEENLDGNENIIDDARGTRESGEIDDEETGLGLFGEDNDDENKEENEEENLNVNEEDEHENKEENMEKDLHLEKNDEPVEEDEHENMEENNEGDLHLEKDDKPVEEDEHESKEENNEGDLHLEKGDKAVEEDEHENKEENVKEDSNLNEDDKLIEKEDELLGNSDGKEEEIAIDNAPEAVLDDGTPLSQELLDAHVVLLLGGPGSGKKTLAGHLVTKYSIAFIHVDQLVKDAIDLESNETEEFKRYLANEEFNEQAIYSLVRRSLLSSLSMSKVLFVAGFPRTADQYQGFNREVCAVSAVLYLEVDEDTLKNRLAARADPDLPLNFVDQLEAFKNNSPTLLEYLSESELFSRIDGSLAEVEVLEQASNIMKDFPFVKHDE